jgi:acyl-CoA thioester hydrolase
VASSQSVSVLIDEISRRPVPLTEQVRQNFEPWWRRGFKPA